MYAEAYETSSKSLFQKGCVYIWCLSPLFSLYVISDQTEMAKEKEYLCVRYLSNRISMFLKYYLISGKPLLRLLLLLPKKKETEVKNTVFSF